MVQVISSRWCALILVTLPLVSHLLPVYGLEPLDLTGCPCASTAASTTIAATTTSATRDHRAAAGHIERAHASADGEPHAV
jgi:hypothetical protein